MKCIALAIFATLAVSANAAVIQPYENWDIDWSKVLPVQEMPGFWDGREIREMMEPSPSQLAERAGRIVNGVESERHSRPFQVGLLMNFAGGTGLCGGSVISNRAVLTAAHCPIGSVSTQKVFAAHQITIVEPQQHRVTTAASGYRIHAQYNPSNLNNDIAIIITAAAFPHNAHIQPVTLALADIGALASVMSLTSGWGRTTNTGPTSPVLREVDNPIITNALCAATYGGTIIASTLCTSTAGGRGTCNGDSGGPLTVVHGGTVTQAGVVSFVAAAGCTNGFPAGFVRVSALRAWINTNMIP